MTNRRTAASARARHLEGQARLNGPEVRFWEQILGLRIEGAGSGEHKDRLKFVFCCVDDLNSALETSFILDMAGKVYSILQTDPALETEAVEGAVARFNDGGNIAGLLKEMRGLFVDCLRDS